MIFSVVSTVKRLTPRLISYYNTELKFKKRHSLRSVNFFFSVLTPEQTAITSLCWINLPVFMAETESVYSAVRTGSWNIIQVNSTICRRRWFCLYIATCNWRCLPTILVTRHGRLVPGLSPRRSGFRPRPKPSDLLWTMWHRDRFVSEYVAFPLSVSFQQCSTLIYSSVTDAI